MRKTFYLTKSDAELFEKLKIYYKNEMSHLPLVKITDSLVLKWLIWYMIKDIDPNKSTERKF